MTTSPETGQRPPLLRPRIPVRSIIQRVLLAFFLLQLLTAAVLQVVSRIRRLRQKAKTFPHRELDEIAVGENNHLKLYSYGCDLYDDMLKAIDEAKDCIMIESFIWKGDAIGRAFRDHLAKKAEEGVDVYVIFDAFGNLVVPRAFKSSFPKNVHLFEFMPVQRIWHIFDPRRYALDHRKILVVDGEISFIGGYNIGSVYATQWRDTHLRIRGEASATLANSFIAFWNRFKPHGIEIERHYQTQFNPLISVHGNDAIRLTFPIRDMYIDAIDRAQNCILLTNAYFLPDHALLAALKNAARRGVDVRILVPWVSNHILTDWISHGYFHECLQAGIRIFSYRHSMLHAKTCTIDDEWSTVGTANLDRLSSIGNFEINVEIYSEEFARQMHTLFDYDTSDTFELTLEDWAKRPWYVKASEKLLAPWRFMM
uniref:Cardiolipin synthase n=1 Tax=Thermosporothrix sp. COM3 TaxID=2490863 RepID=A0A455SBE8_9CHLR|nr:cardiolipin synthase [Thermosporothrix sp. COM3]